MSVIGVYFLAFVCAEILKKRIENIYYIVIAFVDVLLFICGNVGLLGVAATLCNSLFVISFILFVFLLFKKGVNNTQIFSAGSLGILFLTCFFALYSFQRGFYNDDDFYYWGCGLKALYFQMDIRYTSAMYSGIHPIGTLLWDFLATYSWIGYSESIAMWAQCILTISPLISFYGLVNLDNSFGKKTISYAVATFLLIAFPIAMVKWAFFTLMVDAFFATAAAAAVVAFSNYLLYREKDYFIQVLVSLYFIVQSKRIGIVVASLLLFSFAGVLFKRYIKSKKNEDLTMIVAGLISVFGPYLLWEGISLYMCIPFWAVIGAILVVLGTRKYCTGNTNAVLFLTLLMFGLFLVILYIKSDYSSKEVLVNYIRQFFDISFYSIGYVIKVPLFSGVVIGIGIIYWLIIKKDNVHKELLTDLIVYFLISFVIFAGIMAFLYTQIIEPVNNIPPAFARYMVWILAIVLYCAIYYTTKVFIHSPYYSFMFLVFLLSLTNVSDMIENSYHKAPKLCFYGFDGTDIELTKDDTIYFINELNDQTPWHLAFEYYVFPAYAEVNNPFSWMTLEQNGNSYISVNEFSDELVDYDYVYIQSVDKSFASLYSDVFEDNIETGAVYLVNKSNNGISLSIIEK